MKHPEELKTKFLELRARDVSYSRIAEELGVSKPTLIQWGKAMAEDIADLRAAERELVREKLLGNFEQWLGRQVHHFNRLDEEFGRREFKYSPTESVFRMMMVSRKLLDRYFFEDDRPRQRRALEGRAPSSPAATTSSPSQPNGRTAVPPAAASHSQAEALLSPAAASEGSIPLPREEGQDEGDSPSLSVAAPQPSADNPLETGAYSENPAKTPPFPCQNSEIHNPALSSDQSKIENSSAPSRPCAEPSAAESDFGGESIPISPFESTRQWLERQGIQVSKIPKGARIITAG